MAHLGGTATPGDRGKGAARAAPTDTESAGTAATARPQLLPWRVGLTGGIASGKTTVAKLFAALGVPVIDADAAARAVVAPGSALLAQLRERFGPATLAADGSLDRQAMRARVFADPALRRELEALTHPAIRAEMERQSAATGGPYQIFVIPLLAESGRHAHLDRVLVVDCSEALQRERLRARDGSTAAEIDRMLAAQATRAARRALADDLVTNEGDLGALRDAVERLHPLYLRLASSS